MDGTMQGDLVDLLQQPAEQRGVNGSRSNLFDLHGATFGAPVLTKQDFAPLSVNLNPKSSDLGGVKGPNLREFGINDSAGHFPVSCLEPVHNNTASSPVNNHEPQGKF